MKQWKSFICIIIYSLLSIAFTSCQKGRYQKDRKNKLSKSVKKADDFIAKQAIKITQDNNEDRAVEVEKSLNKLKRDQKELKAAGKKIRKNKESPKFSGDFKFY